MEMQRKWLMFVSAAVMSAGLMVVSSQAMAVCEKKNGRVKGEHCTVSGRLLEVERKVRKKIGGRRGRYTKKLKGCVSCKVGEIEVGVKGQTTCNRIQDSKRKPNTNNDVLCRIAEKGSKVMNLAVDTKDNCEKIKGGKFLRYTKSRMTEVFSCAVTAKQKGSTVTVKVMSEETCNDLKDHMDDVAEHVENRKTKDAANSAKGILMCRQYCKINGKPGRVKDARTCKKIRTGVPVSDDIHLDIECEPCSGLTQDGSIVSVQKGACKDIQSDLKNVMCVIGKGNPAPYTLTVAMEPMDGCTKMEHAMLSEELTSDRVDYPCEVFDWYDHSVTVKVANSGMCTKIKKLQFDLEHKTCRGKCNVNGRIVLVSDADMCSQIKGGEVTHFIPKSTKICDKQCHGITNDRRKTVYVEKEACSLLGGT